MHQLKVPFMAILQARIFKFKSNRQVMQFTRLYDRNPVSIAIFARIVKVWDQKSF